MGTSVVAKLGSTRCCSCSVLCVCGTQLPTFVPRHRRGQRTLRHQPNLAPTQSDHRDGFWQQQRQRLRHGPQAPAIRHRRGADKGRQHRRCLPSGTGALLHLCYWCLASCTCCCGASSVVLCCCTVALAAVYFMLMLAPPRRCSVAAAAAHLLLFF